MTAPGMGGLPMMPVPPGPMAMGNALNAIPVLQPVPGAIPQLMQAAPTNQFAQFPPPNPNGPPPGPPQGLIPLSAPVNTIPSYPPMPHQSAPPPQVDAPPGFYPEDNPYSSDKRDEEKKKKKKKRKKKRLDDDGSPPPTRSYEGMGSMIQPLPQVMMMPVML